MKMLMDQRRARVKRKGAEEAIRPGESKEVEARGQGRIFASLAVMEIVRMILTFLGLIPLLVTHVICDFTHPSATWHSSYSQHTVRSGRSLACCVLSIGDYGKRNSRGYEFPEFTCV